MIGKKYGVPDDWIPNEVLAEKLEKEKEEKEKEEYNTDDEKELVSSKKTDEDEKVENEEEEKLVPIYVKARHLFNHHEVEKDLELKWAECQPAELTKFLVDDMGFNPQRVESSIEKLKKAFKATSKPQMRMDSFFKPKPNLNASKKAKGKGTKRPAKESGGKKAKKGAFGRK